MSQSPEAFQQQISALAFPLAQKLGTREGFFEYWFQILPRCKSHKAAFDLANLIHFKIFKEEKYTCYESFKNQKNKYLKNQHS
jgi:hypothetical protein